LKEVFVDPFPQRGVLLQLMIGLGEGSTASAAEGTEGEPFLFGKGKISSGHEKVGIVMDRFNGVATAGKFQNIQEFNVKPLRDFPSGDLVIEGPDRNRTSEKEGIS
jgi:hypothetical protein